MRLTSSRQSKRVEAQVRKVCCAAASSDLRRHRMRRPARTRAPAGSPCSHYSKLDGAPRVARRLKTPEPWIRSVVNPPAGLPPGSCKLSAVSLPSAGCEVAQRSATERAPFDEVAGAVRMGPAPKSKLVAPQGRPPRCRRGQQTGQRAAAPLSSIWPESPGADRAAEVSNLAGGSRCRSGRCWPAQVVVLGEDRRAAGSVADSAGPVLPSRLHGVADVPRVSRLDPALREVARGLS